MLARLALAILVMTAPATGSAAAQSPAPIQLWRLDCGQIYEPDLDLYSDSYAYVGQSRTLVGSCYLIRHGENYMLWDTGLTADHLGKPLTGPGSDGATVATTIVDQLARIGVKPEQVSLIGISHYHYDHTGQAAAFPGATLLLGSADVAVLRQPGDERAAPLAHWLSGAGKLDPVSGDRDVYGDGSVVMLDLPGHTPGHHGLLVRLAHGGPILLSGDTAHFRENYATDGVPGWNTSRAQSLASLARLKALAANLKATLVIQHELRDVSLLPAFPQAAY